MSIAIMGSSLRPGLTGIGRYSLNLVRGVAEALAPEPLTVFTTRAAVGLDGFQGIVVRAPVATPHEALRALWEQLLVPLEVRRRGIALYHGPSHTLPLALPCRGIVTIHDLAFLDPRLHRLRNHLYFSTLATAALDKADHIIAVSDYTRRQLQRLFPSTAGKVTVIHQGLDPRFERPPRRREVARFRRQRGLDGPYILFVGTVEPRKNLVRLVAAFERAIAEGGLPHELVLCGPLGWRYGPVLEAIGRSPLRQRIRHLGYVAQEGLPLWYAGADLFVYPSLWEGFGLPPLEAMACGAPVITSNTTSLPEVVGDAAIMVAPTDVDALAGAMLAVLRDDGLAGELRRRGRQRARRFSSRAAAAATVALYRRVLEGSSRP